MIRFIIGEVADLDENSVVLENNGIGYQIYMPGNALSNLRMGEQVKIHTYFAVREDAMQLYGFLTRDDLQVFQLLINVNGIGPKAGLGVLSALSADELRFAVLADDAKTIAKAPGIGKKTAQKLILELKDKFSLEDAFEQKLEHVQEQSAAAGLEDAKAEAVQALVALGYSNADALRGVSKVVLEEEMDVEAILKAALKNMF